MDQLSDIFFIPGKSAAMRHIYQLVQKIAPTNTTVLITGETGVGKEVLARLIHRLSYRWRNTFVAVNCASLSQNLIESELFGHERGSFTGAETTRIGRFELADKGTLLLDEVSEIDLSLQGKFLRVLEEKEIQRVGSSVSRKIDVRFLSTSNRNLEELVQKGAFRADLYYRLNVIPIYIPPLRERKEDITPLAQYYLKWYCQENNLTQKSFSPDALELLQDYSWPGNVRELFNLIERVSVVSPHELVNSEEIKPFLVKQRTWVTPPYLIGVTLETIEKEMIKSNLSYFNGNRRRTAEALGIADRTLREKLRKFPQILSELKGINS